MPMLRLSDVAIVRLIVAAIVSGHEALVRHYTAPCIPAHLWPSSNVMDLVTLDPGHGHGEIMKIKFPMTIK